MATIATPVASDRETDRFMFIEERPAPLTSQLLSSACDGGAIAHGFFTRQGGVSDGLYDSLNVGLGSQDDQEKVEENRQRVRDFFAVGPNMLATAHQIHSADVFVIDAAYDGERPKADAVVTALPGVAVGVLTADCGPILLADPKAGIVGAAHAGWRGALDGIAENTVAAMVELGAKRSDIVACLGPSISGAHYEVGPEFVERFLASDADSAIYFRPSKRAEHKMFDLPAFTLARLAAAGVQAEQSGRCTYAEEDLFFSYRRSTHRREPDYGRQISAIAITE